MTLYATIIIANLFVGTLIGISGIAGFLLPMIYLGFLNFYPADALALSFTAFLVSGVVGALSYQRLGLLKIKQDIFPGLSCLIGSIIGVYLGSLVPVFYMKLLLYISVFFAGLSLLRKPDKEKSIVHTNPYKYVWPLLIPIGAICSLTGSGGPILIIPLLVLMGFPIKRAIAIGIFDSIFIALPAIGGYLLQASRTDLSFLIVLAGIFQALGTFWGASISGKINHTLLKKSVAFFVIIASLWLLFKLLFA